ncbi:MAG: hypothetical protein U9Q90_06705 [Campylobacterota bacterium]|nr:hypothetical protein [Campylobacterota bacterium]
MKKIVILSVIAAATLFAADAADTAGKAVKGTGDAATEVAKGTVDVTKDVADVTGKAVKGTGDAAAEVAKGTVKATEKAADVTGGVVKKAGDATIGKATEAAH